jgi:hypothetical protein
VPETLLHLKLRTTLYMILAHTLAGRASVGSEQFVYWNAKDPRRCLAPDGFVKLGTPHEWFDSWKTWERGTPELCVEILSASDDWQDKLERYHELGVRELVSFDPENAHIRVWDRVEDDLVERVVEGDATACRMLDAFFVVANVAGARGLRLARDRKGRHLWLTEAEAEAGARKVEAEARKVEHTARIAAEKRVAELEKQLRSRKKR